MMTTWKGGAGMVFVGRGATSHRAGGEEYGGVCSHACGGYNTFWGRQTVPLLLANVARTMVELEPVLPGGHESSLGKVVAGEFGGCCA